SDERNPRRDTAGVDPRVAGGSEGGDTDQRRRERTTDGQLPRRERANLVRSGVDRRIEQRLTVRPMRQPSKDRREGGEVSDRVVFSVPVQARARSYATHISFVLVVVLPVIAASIYYGWIASNQYVAEFRFSVSDTTPTSAASMSSSVLSLLSGGSPNAPLENYMVADYLTSRQAAEELDRRINVRRLYTR